MTSLSDEGAGPAPAAPEGNDSGGQHRRPACRRRRRPIASSAGAEGAGADPRRKGDDYPMTSLSDGLGPQKDPNSGRTRVESGPAGTHRPTTRRGSAIAQPSVPPGTSTPGRRGERRRRPIASTPRRRGDVGPAEGAGRPEP